MVRRIIIPYDIWHFVRYELFNRGYINRNALLLSKEIPKIQWELLSNVEWEAYSHLHMESLKNFEPNEEKAWEEIDHFNLYVAETFKNKKLLKKSPETRRLIVERGFINNDNVILMSESKTEALFKECNKKCIDLLGHPLICSLDGARLAIFILQLINIYKFRVGKDFTGKILNDVQLENQIMLAYLAAHSVDPKNFELESKVISKERKLNEERFFKSIWQALNQKAPSILKDNKGREIARLDIGKLFREKEGKIEVDFGSFGLKVVENFIGLGHILYNPEYLGAGSIQEVMESWNWLLGKTHVDLENFQMALETTSLIVMLKTGIEEGRDVNIFNLAVNLRKLEVSGIDVNPKIEEFGEEIRGHIKSFWKWEKTKMWNGILVTQELRGYLSNVSSECFLAMLSKAYGFDVKLGKHPDLVINGRRVEVKRASSYNISNVIRSAQYQPHDIIAIEANSLEHQRIHNREATWSNEGDLKDAFTNVLKLRCNNDIVLLFMATMEGLKGRIILLK